MTGLGLLNFLVLQWFGVRLAKCECIGCDRGQRRSWQRCTRMRHPRFVVLRWIVPLTGWWSPYRWIARRS